jgi:ABC-type multidrug transport system ATPase subunit
MKNLKYFQTKIPSPTLFPVFAVKEKNIENWIPIDKLSSGMKKVLLILLDAFIAPPESIYLIDEYENSLGINPINFFPTFLDELEKDIQFVITSHHPYIINNLPVDNWYIFHRKGNNITIRFGEENIKRLSKSKQQRFIQLINDPFYLEGVK